MNEDNNIFESQESEDFVSAVNTENEDTAYLDNIYNDIDDEKAIIVQEKNKISPRDRRVIRLLAVLNIVVFVFTGIFILLTGGADEYEDIKSQTSFKTAADYYDVSTVFRDTLAPVLRETEYPNGIKTKFAKLYSSNSDVKGWIKIPDSSIDFCVLQADDNEKYLRSDFFLDYNIRGSIFLDYRNNIGRGRESLSKNTIIYGHLMEEDSLTFTELQNYMDIEYYKSHPIIKMDTIYNDYNWKIIGCFISCPDPENDGGNVFYYWYPDFSDQNSVAFANEVAQRSYFINTDVDILPTDKFLTLSTCTHVLNLKGYVNARCVVIARLVREGESTEVNVDAAKENPNRRMPQLYYDLHGLENPYKNVAVWQAY